TGSFTQAGSGTLTMTGTQTYTGATTVTAGTLSVTGSLASSSGLTVGNGATLGGTGTVSSTTVTSGGTISPGNSVGTLTVNGNLTLAAGSTYVADIAPSAADQIIATGAVTLAGQLTLSSATGTYTLGQSYTLINSAGLLSGLFSNVTYNGNFGGYVPALTYAAHDVFVTLSNQIFWQTNPGSADWNTAPNWTSNSVPTSSDTLGFSATTKSTINIQKAGTQVGGLEFKAGAPAYTFNITGTAAGASSLVISGTGIVDKSSNAPSFVVSGVSGNTGTLEFDNSATAGDATITANAYGNVLFTGSSDAGMATLVAGSGGTVDISGLASAGMSAGAISGSGAFVLGAKSLSVGGLNTSTTVSGVISGSGGSLDKVGTGTLTLTGTNTYTGGTTIVAGTLQLGNGGTGGAVAGNIVDNAQLTFDRSNSYSFGGAISGTGAVTQAGSGTTVLTAASTYSGGTTVQAGTLQVDGSLAVSSGISVQSGAALQGSGTVSTVSVMSGGTLSPGAGMNSVGTLTVTGDATLAAGSTLVIDTGAAATDMIAVRGALNLAGAATINPVTPPHYGDTAVFASATAITGAFSSVNGNFTGVLYPVISTLNTATGKELVVTVDASSFASYLTAPGKDVSAIATVLDAARAAHYPDLKSLYDSVDTLSSKDLATAFTDMVPDSARSLPLITQMQVSGFTDIIWNRLAALEGGAGASGTTAFDINTDALDLARRDTAPFSQNNTLLDFGQQVGALRTASVSEAQATEGWVNFGKNVSGFFDGASLNGTVATGGAHHAHVNGYLIAAGLEAEVSPHFVVGAALSYADSTAKTSAIPSNSSSKSYQGAAYARYERGGWFVDGFAGTSGQQISTDRSAVIGSTTFKLHGHTSGSAPMAGFEAGRKFEAANFEIMPAAGLQWQQNSIQGYKETGGIAAMSYHDYSLTSITGRIGFDAVGTFRETNFVVQPLLHAFLVHDFDSSAGNLVAAFTQLPTSPMPFALPRKSATWAELGIGAQASVSDATTLRVRYDTTLGRSDMSWGAVTGEINIRF
ncbi:MAG: autotransporter domain-containing protein, partial [Alphaproteobacteria bacterium]|nr:autotransporter domain-containing protein [Alphaproteobacteria bacterium]